MASRKHVFAMGGAFLADPDSNLRLETYFRDLTGLDRPKVLFVPTASGDHEGYQLRFFQAFTKLGCRPAVLPFFRRTPRDLEGFVREHDAIAVGGGNTRSMLAIWRDWGLDTILRAAYDDGVPMGGSSAGSICWFDVGITDSIAGPLTALPCLGFVAGSNCPHYDSEKDRRPAYQELIATGQVPDGHAADDGVGLHFVDGVFHQAVANREKALAWAVRRTDAGVDEQAVEPVRPA
ncbi:MAG: peptidase E [Betaproteobacteria bacterium]|nr:peptidase E [Betaproteobacteria bacterium]